MATCPECEFDEIETADYEEGDTFSCPECGKNLMLLGADEVEIAGDEDEDLDDDDEDGDEDDLEDDEKTVDEDVEELVRRPIAGAFLRSSRASIQSSSLSAAASIVRS